MMLTLRFRMQNQASFETISASDLSINDAQFTIRRVRLRLNGFVLDPRLTFLLQLSFTRGDADFDNTQFFNVLRDAMMQYRITPNVQLGFGMGKLPGNRQRVVSSGEQQFVDRSIVNRAFNIDRDVGFFFYYNQPFAEETSAPRVSLRAALTTGEGRNPRLTVAGLAYTARLAVFPLGNFTNNGDYFESDLAFEETPKAYIAAVYSLNNNATRTNGQTGLPLYANRTMESYVVDGMLKYRGFSFYGEYSRRTAQNPVTADGTSVRAVLAGFGVNLQAAYLFAGQWETALRYSSVMPEAAVQAFVLGQTQYTACLTRYFNGHRIKAQADLTYNINHDLHRAQNIALWILRLQMELGL
jgi:phosphate-selective porin OprO and OprP